MRGIELMLMGIFATFNGTDYYKGKPPEIDDELDLSKMDISLAAENLKIPKKTMPPHIKVTSWENMPYSDIRKTPDGIWEGGGHAFYLLNLIRNKLNFTYTVVAPTKVELGHKNSGILRLLNNSEVDMAVAFIPMMPEIHELCSFSSTMDDVQITFMMTRPRESATGSGLLAPFDRTVWICILIALIVFGPSIYVLIHLRTIMSEKGHPEGYSLRTCIWFAYGALLKQGSTVTPVTDTSRLLFATWWIFITILTSFYTANLTAFLTLSEFTLSYNSIHDLVYKQQKWFTLSDQTIYNSIENGRYDEELGPLKQSYAKYGKYTSKGDGFRSILNVVDEGRIFLGERTLVETIMFKDYRLKTLERTDESKRCTYVLLPTDVFIRSRAFAYPHNSAIADIMNKQLMNLVETGIVKHLRTNDLPTVRYCPLNLKSTERRLRNADLRMTYIVVAVGFTIATATFFGEMIYRIFQLRNGFSCGKCCGKLCCRTKIKSAELPIFSVKDPRPLFLKQKAWPVDGNLYNRRLVEKHFINGRDYWVIKEKDGDQRLVPIRTPSALLFQY